MHARRNMDIIGVPGVAAEAELLAAIVLLHERLGLTAQDVVIKVSSRRVLSAILARYGVPEASVGPVSVVVDKMEKIPLEKVRAVVQRGYSRRSSLSGKDGPGVPEGLCDPLLSSSPGLDGAHRASRSWASTPGPTHYLIRLQGCGQELFATRSRWTLED